MDEQARDHALDEFKPVCATHEVPQMMPKLVQVNGRGVLICRNGDEFYGVDEICPHKQKSMAFGVVFDGTIICPWHSYTFDLSTGRCKPKKCAPVHVYDVRVVDDMVYVRA